MTDAGASYATVVCMASIIEPPFWRDLLWQEEVISRAQLVGFGITDSWLRAKVASGRWQRLLPGVYLARGGPVDYRMRVWAGVLYAGPGALASHHSAAFLHGLIDTQPDCVHVVVPGHRRVRPQPGLVVRRVASGVLAGAIFSERPPRTSAEATILDLTDLSRRDDEVVALVTGALARRIAHPARLSRLVAGRLRLRWRGLIAEMLVEGAGIESPLEWRYHRDIERSHALPVSRRQVAARTENGMIRRDVYYEEQRVVVELDGVLGHAGTGAFRDAVRDNASALRGEITLRYGWLDVVAAPCTVAAQVASILSARGWSGIPISCGQTCVVGLGSGLP